MDPLKSEMQRMIDTFSEDALSRFERAFLPITQERRIQARAMKENLLASYARLEKDPSGASIEKAREEMNFSRDTSWMLMCMAGELTLTDIKSDALAETVMSILQKYEDQSLSELSEKDIDELMAASTVGDIIEEVGKDSSEYGSCLVRQTDRPKMIRADLQLMNKVGYKLVTFKGRTHLAHRKHLLEVGEVGEVAGDFVLHLSGSIYENPGPTVPKYELPLQSGVQVYVMGSMTMNRFMKEANAQIRNSEHAGSLLNVKCMKSWVGHGTSLITSVGKINYKGLRAHTELTLLEIRDSSFRKRTLSAFMTWRVGIHISQDFGLNFDLEKSWTESPPNNNVGAKHFNVVYAREKQIKEKCKTGQKVVRCHDLRNAWIMMNNYFEADSGNVHQDKSCAYKRTGESKVMVSGTTWRAARLAGWIIEEEDGYAVSPDGEVYELITDERVQGYDHVSQSSLTVYIKEGSKDCREVSEA